MVVVQLTLLVVFLIILAFAANRLVRYLVDLSGFYGLPTFLVSFVILGFGTSLPDLFIGAISSARGEFSLVLGTVIGANILVVCLVLGVVTLVKGRLWIREKTVIENFGWIFFVLMIPFFLLFDGRLTLFEGLILVVVYFMYLYNVKEHQSYFRRAEGQQSLLQTTESVTRRGKPFLRKIGQAVLALAVVLAASFLVVDNALSLSRSIGIPPVLIGMSVVALGVALPELALNLSALRAKEEEVIWGDLIGSFITELTLILGVAALFSAPGNGVFDFG
ncbi:MAG: hypothetical protein AB1626_05025, partial [Candidatus Micrarchaeota archaeon]